MGGWGRESCWETVKIIQVLRPELEQKRMPGRQRRQSIRKMGFPGPGKSLPLDRQKGPRPRRRLRRQEGMRPGVGVGSGVREGYGHPHSFPGSTTTSQSSLWSSTETSRTGDPGVPLAAATVGR